MQNGPELFSTAEDVQSASDRVCCDLAREHAARRFPPLVDRATPDQRQGAVVSQDAVTSMALTFEIFRSGTHTPMVGSAASFSEADLDSIVRAYDPALHEAPIVIGHPKDNAPAFGWVKGLARAGDRLRASVDPTTLHLGFAEAVKSGAYKKRSASFYRPESPNNPKPGTYYLRHVGFLGAMPPAVKGLADIELAGGADDCVDIELDFAELDFALLLRSLRDWLIGKFGVEEADKALPPWDVNNTQAAGVIQAAQGDPMSMKSPSFAENQPGAGAAPAAAPKGPDLEKLWTLIATFLPADMPEADKVAKKKLVEDALKGEEPAPAAAAPTAEHAERQRKLDAREAELAKKEAAQRAGEHASFLESHVRAGKPLPATREACLGLMSILDAPSVDVSFGENDKRKPLEVFRDLLANVRAEIDFSERSGGAEDEADHAERDAERETAKEALAFQEAEQKKGNIITTAEAVRHVKKGKATK